MAMIARLWSGKSSSAKADAYQHHFTATVAASLKDIAGHRGAYLLRRENNGEVEFLAVTLWDSLEAIKKFAGPNPETAIVEPEGRAALTQIDDCAAHYDVAYGGTQDR
jgi:heme-degrading monooxygenase HmoA